MTVCVKSHVIIKILKGVGGRTFDTRLASKDKNAFREVIKADENQKKIGHNDVNER